MAVINNVPGQSIQEQIHSQYMIQSRKPYPSCNICDVPGQSAKQTINALYEISKRPNNVPGQDNFVNSNKQTESSFLDKIKNFFKK